MTSQIEHKPIQTSFVTLMAMLMSFIALAIDAMMPALGQIGQDLAVENPNDVQLIISTIFIGMAIGLLFFGPFADSFGRKKAIFLGLGIFLIGCLASIFSTSFDVMLYGRLLQGIGAASCRVATMCMIRDEYEGPAMAKIMSFIMIIFILSPALAPSIGQIILIFGNWRWIFVVMFSFAVVGISWLALGQEETLKPEHRLRFGLAPIYRAMKETIKNRIARGYTLASGIVSGAFVAYLNSAQQILQEQYETGDAFALIFGFLALAIGVASYTNSKLVYKMSIEKICFIALIVMAISSTVFLPISLITGGNPALILLIIYLFIVFFCMGLLFGNFSTLAILPLGHIAGSANSVIGFFQTLISALLGAYIGSHYNGTINPLVLGFFVLSITSLAMVFRLINTTADKPVSIPN